MVLFLPFEMAGQTAIKDLVKSLSNDKLVFEVAKVGASRVTANTIELPKNFVVIKSYDVDALLAKVTKIKLIKSLIPMLTDTTKDWYANVLLYQITGRDATLLIVIENREAWVTRNRKKDIEYWNSYFEREP